MARLSKDGVVGAVTGLARGVVPRAVRTGFGGAISMMIYRYQHFRWGVSQRRGGSTLCVCCHPMGRLGGGVCVWLGGVVCVCIRGRPRVCFRPSLW